jgi:endonuclease/exonuclease/phosphatase family metal-dependent hydrolase
VAAVLVAVVGSLGGTGSVAPQSAPLAAPERVRVVPQDTTATALWVRDVGGAESFRVEYASSPDFSDAQATTVRDGPIALESLDPGSTYFLRVSAVGEGGTSAPSRPVEFTTGFPAEAPRPRASTHSSTAVKATWTAVGDDLVYETQLSTDDAFADPRTLDGPKTAARFDALDPGTTYWMRVRALDDDQVAQSEWSDPVSLDTLRSEPLGVGTYNVLKWNRHNWSARRGGVADLIRSSHLDVVGLQEATPAHVGGGGPRQYQDVVNLLGPDWALTRTSSGATGETRTVYDRTQVDLVSEGYRTIAGSSRFRGVARYVAWSVFEQKSTGKSFLFVNTHLTPGRGRAEASQRASGARQLVATVAEINTDDLPVIIGGDFNTSLPRTVSANPIYAAITGAGYLDPLVRSGELGSAEKLVDADLKTVNNLSRTAPRRANPALIDHLFVSPMRVSQWQVAANLDAAGRFIGTIPSDHNLVRATVYLP